MVRVPPPSPPPRATPPRGGSPATSPRDPVKEFKSKLHVIYHAVEEHDWDRLKLPEFMKLLGEIEAEAKELERKDVLKTRYLPASEVALTLRYAIGSRDAERALWAISELLFGLPP
jgi:hypothetical protein